MGGGLSTFAYTGGNPITRIDPLGLWFGFDDVFTGPIDEVIVISAIIGAASSSTNTSSENGSDGQCETCQTKYPEYPSCSSLSGYGYDSKRDALSTFRIRGVKLHNPSPSHSGPCAGQGMHWNVRSGSMRLGSITSCKCCEDTPNGPVLKTKYRVH